MSPSRSTRRFVLSLLGPDPRVPEGVEWDEVTELLRLHSLVGLAVTRHRSEGGGVLPRELAEGLEAEFRVVELATTLQLEAGERARSALRREGIRSLYFKGAALVRAGAYPGPGARPMDDVDLLVPAERAKAAVDALRNAGFRPWAPWEEGREVWLDSFTMELEGASGGFRRVVDLHWRTGYGDLRFGEDGRESSVLWRGARVGQGLPASAPHLLVVAEHVLKHLRHRVHVLGLCDLAVLAEGVEDWDAFYALARSSAQVPGVGLLLDLVREAAGAPIPVEAASVLGADGPWMRPARALVDPERLLGRERAVDGRARGLLLRWLLAGSASRALADAGRAAFPGSTWLRARYREGGEAGGGSSPARLRLRYWGDVLGWLLNGGPSPASPNQEVGTPVERG